MPTPLTELLSSTCIQEAPSVAATSRVAYLTIQQHRVLELKFCGNVHLLVSRAFMALTGTTLVENIPEVNEYV
jgi:hypothetical protein